MPTLTTSPWDKAVARLSEKTLVGSRLRSAEWAEVPLALREGAFFSAGVEHARTLSAMREKLLQGAEQLRPGGTGMNRARFVADMREMLGAAPGDSGDLADVTSVRRLELIWNFQQQDAHAHAAHKADMDPNLLDAFPAYRLVRIESRRVPRDWLDLWAAAGAAVSWVGASRRTMVALKTSPIWAEISQFGRPWPPFRYGSGMGLEDVDRDEAESLDLLPKGEPPAERLARLREGSAQARRRWNSQLSASVKGLSVQAKGWLQSAFGDQISIEGSRVAWRGATATPIAPTPAPSVPTIEPIPEVDRVAVAVAKAESRTQAHAVLALPPTSRGSLSLNPSAAAAPQAEEAGRFLASVVHKDVAPAATCKVHLLAGRAHYDPALAIAYARAGDVSTTIHEIGHHLEITNPRIAAECRAYLMSRAKPGETPRRLSLITGNYGFRPNEIAIEDEWAARGGSVYSGKVYPESMRATEVLSMGLQRMFDSPVAFAREDPDYFKFLLRVLRPSP